MKLNVIDNVIKSVDSFTAYTRYKNAIMHEDYKTALRLYRQAEQDAELTDKEVNKLFADFKSKFGNMP